MRNVEENEILQEISGVVSRFPAISWKIDYLGDSAR